jgi:hypothetical protein
MKVEGIIIIIFILLKKRDFALFLLSVMEQTLLIIALLHIDLNLEYGLNYENSENFKLFR